MNNPLDQLKSLDAAADAGTLPMIDVRDRVMRKIARGESLRSDAATWRIFVAFATSASVAALLALAMSWNAWEAFRDPMSTLLSTISGSVS